MISPRDEEARRAHEIALEIAVATCKLQALARARAAKRRHDAMAGRVPPSEPPELPRLSGEAESTSTRMGADEAASGGAGGAAGGAAGAGSSDRQLRQPLQRSDSVDRAQLAFLAAGMGEAMGEPGLVGLSEVRASTASGAAGGSPTGSATSAPARPDAPVPYACNAPAAPAAFPGQLFLNAEPFTTQLKIGGRSASQPPPPPPRASSHAFSSEEGDAGGERGEEMPREGEATSIAQRSDPRVLLRV